MNISILGRNFVSARNLKVGIGTLDCKLSKTVVKFLYSNKITLMKQGSKNLGIKP